MKHTWHIIKEITGKRKLNSNRFPKSVIVNGKTVKKTSHIEEEINKYFTTVVPTLQNTSKIFENFLFLIEKNMKYRDLTLKNLKKLFSQ